MTDADRTEISDLCLLAGRPELATCYLEQGLSTEAVKESLLKLAHDEKPLGRAEVLAGAGIEAERKLTLVDIPELGGRVWVREIDPFERMALCAFNLERTPLAIYKTGLVLWTSIVDEKGHQLLSEPDVIKLGQTLTSEAITAILGRIKDAALGKEE